MVVIGYIDRVSGKRVRPVARWPHRPNLDWRSQSLSMSPLLPAPPIRLSPRRPLGGVPLPRSPRLNPPPPPVCPPPKAPPSKPAKNRFPNEEEDDVAHHALVLPRDALRDWVCVSNLLHSGITVSRQTRHCKVSKAMPPCKEQRNCGWLIMDMTFFKKKIMDMMMLY